jgi:hypothetical protein
MDENANAGQSHRMNTKFPKSQPPSLMIESLETRQFLSADGVAELETLAGTTGAAVTADATPAAVAASTSRHHTHHRHARHHQHALHEKRRQKSHKHHLHTLHAAHMVRRQAHHRHHAHYLHTQHKAHVLRSTVPEPIVLTAQQRNDWAAIRDEFLANRKRISK